MSAKRLLQYLLMLVAFLATSLPTQAAMVDTAQLQASQVVIDLGSMMAKRGWIEEQLVIGGVEAANAARRVAALTDAQVLEIHQRIDEEPAGGSSTLIIIFLILVITELLGVTDIVPDWP